MNLLNGYYTVGGQIQPNKLYAMLHASETKQDLKWWYYDDVYEKASTIPIDYSNISLEQLYKERALQLRGSYDYLILNYSGGADSHNILMTFLKNNIKLDHIYIQWPERLMDKGIYTPNTQDVRGSNFWSEWDFGIKKDLEWLGKNYPDITIEIDDWTTNLSTKFYNDDLFTKNVNNLPSIARSQKQNTFCKTESNLALNGKKVASIYGVDKALIEKKNGKWFFYFADGACMAQPNPDNPNGIEYFYYSPDLPQISVAQAHKLAEWFEKHIDKQYLVLNPQERSVIDPTYASLTYRNHYEEYHEVSEITKLICYPHWDFSRFQAEKVFHQLDGLPMGVRLWDNILTVFPDFERVQQHWEYTWKSYLAKIDMKYMKRGDSKDTFAMVKSKMHPILFKQDFIFDK